MSKYFGRDKRGKEIEVLENEDWFDRTLDDLEVNLKGRRRLRELCALLIDMRRRYNPNRLLGEALLGRKQLLRIPMAFRNERRSGAELGEELFKPTRSPKHKSKDIKDV